MIGKGEWFDLISRTAKDLNNPALSIPESMRNYHVREDKYFAQVKSVDNKYIEY